jgi:chemosensory pili system protein ChpA (sensor histidine kinase/response regulator)
MGGPKTVLVADDSDLVRDYARAVLESRGIALVTASDGADAVRLAHERRPDAIVLDVHMPKVDGLSALLHLQGDETTRDIPVLVMSGRPGGELQRLATAYGAKAFLAKPFRLTQLVEAVEALLRREPAKA